MSLLKLTKILKINKILEKVRSIICMIIVD